MTSLDSRNARFKNCYEDLEWKHVIRTQNDVAAAMGTTQANVSLALKGTRLTARFIRRFCDAFPMYSYEWILYGNGRMLVEDEQTAPQPEPRSIEEVEQKTQLSIVELAATLIKEQESLRRQLTDTLYEVRTLRNEMARDRDTIKDLREALSTLLFKREETSLPLAAESHDLPTNSPKH